MLGLLFSPRAAAERLTTEVPFVRATLPPSGPVASIPRRLNSARPSGLQAARPANCTVAADEASRLAAAVNAHWMSSTGVVVHVLEHGITPFSLDQVDQWTRVTGAQFWAHVAQPDRTDNPGAAPSGHQSAHTARPLEAPHDHLSASIISHAHPLMFEPGKILSNSSHPGLRAVGNQLRPYRHMPVLVFRSAAALDRLKCCYPKDGGTLGGMAFASGCRPPALRGGGLEACLAQTHSGRYNELILDTSRDSVALGRSVSAIAIHAQASKTAMSLASDVQKAACDDGLALPLLVYEPTRAAEPFRVSTLR